MTCIVGIVENDVVYMGADSAGSDGNIKFQRKDSKLFKNGDFLIGFTSSYRMGQLLRFKFKPPEFRPDEKDIYEYMVSDFVDAVRKCLKNGGFAEKDNGVERGGTFLVGFKGRLFRIEGDYQVGENFYNYNACGCGEDCAFGSLYSTENMEPQKRLEIALNAAQEFSTGVASPFIFDKI